MFVFSDLLKKRGLLLPSSFNKAMGSIIPIETFRTVRHDDQWRGVLLGGTSTRFPDEEDEIRIEYGFARCSSTRFMVGETEFVGYVSSKGVWTHSINLR